MSTADDRERVGLTKDGTYVAGYAGLLPTDDGWRTVWPDELQNQIDCCYGCTCTCYAHSGDECGCGADWRTPSEVVMDWMLEHPETRHEVLDAWCETRCEEDADA